MCVYKHSEVLSWLAALYNKAKQENTKELHFGIINHLDVQAILKIINQKKSFKSITQIP